MTQISPSRKNINPLLPLKNVGFRLPTKQVTVNLAPADLKKEGTLFDLPIALAILLAGNHVEAEKQFLEDNGIEVLKYKGLQLLDVRDIINVSPYTMYQLAKEVDLPEADAIFISCAGLGVLDIIQMLEDDLGKPVMSTNQIGIWHAFQIAKIGEPIEGFGKLLREP